MCSVQLFKFVFSGTRTQDLQLTVSPHCAPLCPLQKKKKIITEKAQKVYIVFKVPAGPGSDESVINQKLKCKFSRKKYS